MIALVIITWQARRLVPALRWRRQGQDPGTGPRSQALQDQILHLFPGDFSTATSFITETGPLIPCDFVCKLVSLQPERLEAFCAASRQLASRPAGQQDLCPCSETRAVGLAGLCESRVPRGVPRSWFTACIIGPGSWTCFCWQGNSKLRES